SLARAPTQRAARCYLPARAAALARHAAAAAGLVSDADLRRERRTGSIRTDLHRGRGPGAEPLGMAGTVQGKGATVSGPRSAVAHVPFDRPVLIRHVGPRLVAQISVGRRSIGPEDSEQRQSVRGYAHVVAVYEAPAILQRFQVPHGRAARCEADGGPVHPDRRGRTAPVEEPDRTAAARRERLGPDLLARAVVVDLDRLERVR